MAGSTMSCVDDKVSAFANGNGRSNFDVEFRDQPPRIKAPPWQYSRQLDKLFAQRDASVPVHFWLPIPPEQRPNYRIRAQLVYSRPEFWPEAVSRCANHLSQDSSPEAAHLLQSDASGAVYEQADGHRSVLVPLSSVPFQRQLSVRYRATCAGTCPSVSRRALKLIFALETTDGRQVERRCLDLRVCSCPGRDASRDEELVLKQRTRWPQRVGDGPGEEEADASDDDVEYEIEIRGGRCDAVVRFVHRMLTAYEARSAEFR